VRVNERCVCEGVCMSLGRDSLFTHRYFIRLRRK